MNDIDKLALTDGPDGVVVAVKAVPNASRDRIVGVLGDCLKVTVSAPAEKGKANKAIAKLLASTLGLSQRDVTLTAGATNPRKEFRLGGVSAVRAQGLLRQL